MMKILLIISMVLVPSVFAHTSDEVATEIKRKYAYKEWSEDEYRMLNIMLHEEHHDSLGLTYEEINPNVKFMHENELLSAHIAKEIFYTENFMTVESASIAHFCSVSLTYGYTSEEIVKMIKDNLFKLDNIPDFDNALLSIDCLMIRMLSGYGSYEDISLIDTIEERGTGKFKQMANMARKRITDRRNAGEKPQTEFEKNQLTAFRSHDGKASESLPEERPEKTLPKTPSSEDAKPGSFSWWLLGIVGLSILLGFILLKGRSK